ncbi:MAG TPA: hypothetical protein PLB25_05960 [Rhodoferax sp.]|nr:hypothetical protein [Rhodoferax sp.]
MTAFAVSDTLCKRLLSTKLKVGFGFFIEFLGMPAGVGFGSFAANRSQQRTSPPARLACAWLSVRWKARCCCSF